MNLVGAFLRALGGAPKRICNLGLHKFQVLHVSRDDGGAFRKGSDGDGISSILAIVQGSIDLDFAIANELFRAA